jgi:hypothetical protein
MPRQQDFVVMVALAVAAATTSVWGQELVPSAEPADNRAQSSIPDLSGIWSRPYFGVDPPISGPGPVRGRPGVGPRIVGDYTNPILRPHAAEAVKKFAEMELSGVTHPNPRNQCWPEGLPLVFVNPAIQMIQEPTKVTILYEHDN